MRSRTDEDALTADIIALASQYGRYGYRRIAILLRDAGWAVNMKRVERIWRREGLKVPSRQPKKSRLWLNDGSCIRLRPERPNHVWSYDFVESRTHDGRKFRMLNVIDEFTREYPRMIRVDQGSEFVSRDMDLWAYQRGVTLDFSRPGKPTDNAYIEAFNGRFRTECLNQHWFLTLADAAEKLEAWRRYYNEERPHGAIGNKVPVALTKSGGATSPSP